jgi:hypothetical protein
MTRPHRSFVTQPTRTMRCVRLLRTIFTTYIARELHIRSAKPITSSRAGDTGKNALTVMVVTCGAGLHLLYSYVRGLRRLDGQAREKNGSNG